MPGKHNNSTLSSKIIILIGLSLVSMQIKAQRELEILRGIQYSDAPNSLYHYLAKQAFVYLDKRSETIAQLRSLPQWQQRRQWVRETLNEVIGGFPEKKPLQAKVVKIVNKDGYRIENIIYESQPGYHVTASLFIPAEIKNIKAKYSL